MLSEKKKNEYSETETAHAKKFNVIFIHFQHLLYGSITLRNFCSGLKSVIHKSIKQKKEEKKVTYTAMNLKPVLKKKLTFDRRFMILN